MGDRMTLTMPASSLVTTRAWLVGTGIQSSEDPVMGSLAMMAMREHLSPWRKMQYCRWGTPGVVEVVRQQV